MSNPDFPGPSWQDRSSFPGARGGYGRGGAAGYGGASNYPGRPAYDSGAAGGPAKGARHSRADGYRGYDARRGYPSTGNGRDLDDRGDNGYGRGYGRDDPRGNGYGRNGSDGYGRDGDYRRAGGHRRSAGYDDARGDYGQDGYAGNGAGGWRGGRDRIRGALKARVGSRGAGQYAATGIDLDQDELEVPGPPGPRRPGRRGRRPPRPPGNFLQRQWRARWWRRWTIKKAVGVLGGIAAAMVLVLVAGFFYAYSTVGLPLQALSTPPIQSSVVFYSNGQPIGTFGAQNRTVLSTAKLAQNPYLEEAFLAAEDRNFWHEGGISVTGTIRAILVDLSGGGSQGGSTITEQFVKSYLVPGGGSLTLKEKLKEIIIAIKLANSESKAWILTHYLNVIDLGSGAYGVEAAAQTYFGKDAWQLSIAQYAMLAAMVQQPYGFDPNHPAQNAPGLNYSLLDRWIYVLGNMARDNPGITQQQFNALVPYPNPQPGQQTQADLQHFPKITGSPPNAGSTGYRYYLMNLVQNELQAYYGYSYNDLTRLGLQVHTTIDEHLMAMLNRTIRQDKGMIRQYATQYGGMPLPRWVHIGVVLEEPGTGAIKAFYAGPGFGAKHCVFCDERTGTILNPEQVGSSFKPYVLTTAVSQYMNAKTSILNSHSPLCIPPADKGAQYQQQLSVQSLHNCNTPFGYYALNQPGENFKQSLAVPAATALSSNPAFEDLIHRTGVYSVIDMARNLGVSPSTVQGLEKVFGPNGQFPGSVTAALGQGPLTVVDQANTFATLVSNGITALPHVIKRVVDNNGNPLPIPAVYRPQHLLKPYVAADADYALSFDTTMPGATGHNAYIGRPVIAKTGTLGSATQASQAWFIGAIPQYSMAVALYTDKPAHEYLDNLPTIGGWTGGYGGAWPATIWRTIMSKLITNLPVQQLPTPSFNAPFVKWVQVKPVAPQKCKQGPPWFGGGNGNGPGNGHGHHHHGFFTGALLGPKQCKGGPSPSPSPSPSSSSPSPSPSPSTSSPSPSPSPSLTLPMPGHVPGPRPRPSAPSLTASAVLPRQPVWRPLWAPVPTGLR